MNRLPLIAITLVTGVAAGALAQDARLRHLNPPQLPTSSGYTQVVVPQRGRLAFIAGQVSVDKSGAIVGKGDFTAQAKQVFENLKAAVESAGGTMADVAKINIYVTDVSNIAALVEVRRQYFAANPPASTFVQVVSLARPEFLLEIEAIAAVD